MAEVYAHTGTMVAVMAGNDSTMDLVAGKVAARAKALAPFVTGAYQRSIEISRVAGRSGVTDRGVTATDRWAASIENGWTDRAGNWHPGHHTMRKTARSM